MVVKQALGQIAQDTIEGLKDQVKHTGTTAKRESVNIVKEIFGQGSDDEQQPGSTGSASSKSSTGIQNQNLSVRAQQREVERQKELAAIRRRKDQMTAETERLRLEEEREEQDEEKAGADKSMAEHKKIKQLRQEEEKKETLAPKHIRGLQGTKEMGARKGF